MEPEVEIIIPGLAVFLNLEGENKTMGDPGFILVRTDRHDHGEGHHQAHSHAEEEPEPAHDEHIPFLAYDSRTTSVESESKWKDVPEAPGFLYVPLSGVEVSIAEDSRKGPLTVKSSYHRKVAKKDDYWPAAANQWNRAYVPERGRKPSSMVVAAYMRLFTGVIAAGKPTKQVWTFPVDHDPQNPHADTFAFEVIYSKVPNTHGTITIIETCLDCGHHERQHRFWPKREGQKITLFIGNNTLEDMKNAVLRRQSNNVAAGAHFAFLNRIADATLGLGDGPIPEPELEELDDGEEEPPVGGTDGYCGPVNGNN